MRLGSRSLITFLLFVLVSILGALVPWTLFLLLASSLRLGLILERLVYRLLITLGYDDVGKFWRLT